MTKMATMAIWRFPFTVENRFTISMPAGASLLSVETLNNVTYVWAKVNPDAPLDVRVFRAFGAGRPNDESKPMRYVGSFHTSEDAVVLFHLFEVMLREDDEAIPSPLSCLGHPRRRSQMNAAGVDVPFQQQQR